MVNFEVTYLDDGDHITGGEAHLVSSHQELKGVFVYPHLTMFCPHKNSIHVGEHDKIDLKRRDAHRGVVFLHHVGACDCRCPFENATELLPSTVLFPLTSSPNQLLVTTHICDSGEPLPPPPSGRMPPPGGGESIGAANQASQYLQMQIRLTDGALRAGGGLY